MSDSGSDTWAQLRRFTPARIGLGRVGGSVPTRALLDFELAHARARDAVHAELNVEGLGRHLRDNGLGEPLIVASQVRDRMEYLLRPDLGRTLDEKSRDLLHSLRQQAESGRPRHSCELAVVIADGLSAVAPERHAAPLLCALRDGAAWDSQRVATIIAKSARVALGDEIGEILHAQAVLVLIGERPGLSSPDSLGAYLTWAPRVGRTDADRNCISNIRPEGLPCDEAARRLLYLLSEARRLQLSGVALKDDSEGGAPLLP